MKRSMTVLSAAMFATAMSVGATMSPAFAQVGAGVAGNANVGVPSGHAGANSDTANSDAERTEPAPPVIPPPTTLHRDDHLRSEAAASRSTSIDSSAPRTGAAANDNAGGDNSATGGY
jgi:hypothetical protein